MNLWNISYVFKHLVTRTTKLDDQNVLKNQNVPGPNLNLTFQLFNLTLLSKNHRKLIHPRKLKKKFLGKGNKLFFFPY